MRTRLPGAVAVVYDDRNGLAIGFGPTERAKDANFSITLWPRWVSLFFVQPRSCSRDGPRGLIAGGVVAAGNHGMGS